ncbi:MAG: PmoA family protein [Armatimonadetes bacterium]|nr:PmoA family protein [Armatimonadota bacterium]MDE2206212.1 PmoA family protein [Armatimonadota bacterium]
MFEVTETAGAVAITSSGQEVALYVYNAPGHQPALTRLYAANGAQLLANGPLDSPHHHGVWAGHGSVDGVDFWHNRHNSGRIVHRRFESVHGGEQSASITQVCDWVQPNGVPLLTDTRTIVVSQGAGDAHCVDFEILLRAAGAATVTLAPVREFGMPALRVARELAPRGGGAMQSADGATTEKAMLGKRSRWVHFSGKVGRHSAGIAIMEDPRNNDHPTAWYVRDYGLAAGNGPLFADEPLTVAPRRPLRFRYRIWAHNGLHEEVSAAWDRFAAAPV